MIRATTTILLLLLAGIAMSTEQSFSETLKEFTTPKPESEYDEKLIEQISKVGWYNLHIAKENTNPPFSFTIGHFQSRQHPEIIVLGLPPELANNLLNIAAVKIHGGKEQLRTYQEYTDFTEALSVAFVPVDLKHYKEYLGYANWYYGSLSQPYPVLQMVWPDKQGKFPWQEGYDKRYFQLQPLLVTKP